MSPFQFQKACKVFKRSGFAFKAPPQGVGVIGTPSSEPFSVSKDV
ncbi:hypothetical protein VCRA2126O85_150107 [Vibrio crassostreae]|nr:hypothetical protein VCRA2126O86_120018 [Vibrio crassostreae]CAK2597679.1 hypothetical protein VCRA2127O91_120018 [Vibrio crassostreae]CAK2650929.1 hypothetical protein VCRA2126O85_150107 [Vibrio crassostreae]CAK3153316.1 hypothetical protein VCRA2128O105_140018 [Vibrio crassostreae]CAK3182075.1 hypothetical protein VCRA2128O102_10002 [Vibrio crassostreae]